MEKEAFVGWRNSGTRFRLEVVSVLLVLCLLGCRDSGTSSTTSSGVDEEGLTAVTVQLNWYPESEHAGVFAAKAAGLYEAAGLEVRIRPGGQGTRIGPELATGRVDFAFANADDVVLFREEGVDAVAVLAAMQNNPRCILVRADSGVEKFEDLRGMILQRQPGRPFLAFLQSRGLLDGVQLVPYSGSVAGLVNSKNTAIQAYSFAEPMLAEQQGVPIKAMMVSDLGWNPYSSVIVTTGEMIREKPDVVRRFVAASVEGWKKYLQDPMLADRAILSANEEGMTQEALSYGYEGLKKLALPEGFNREQVGEMSAGRWESLLEQMAELGLADATKVRAEDCFTTEFLSTK